MSTHKKWSIAKSIFRFVGCIGVVFAHSGGFTWFAGWFAAAEALGIAEEIGEP